MFILKGQSTSFQTESHMEVKNVSDVRRIKKRLFCLISENKELKTEVETVSSNVTNTKPPYLPLILLFPWKKSGTIITVAFALSWSLDLPLLDCVLLLNFHCHGKVLIYSFKLLLPLFPFPICFVLIWFGVLTNKVLFYTFVTKAEFVTDKPTIK